MSNDVVSWQEQMAARVAEVKETEQPALTVLSLAGGIMSIADIAIPNNKMQGVILAVGIERSFYDRSYDPNDKSPPDCYSQMVGNDDVWNPTMIPAANVPSPRAATCAECEYSKRGSAANGRGPGCKTRRRLVIAPAIIANEPEKLGKQLVLVNVPPTSGKNFSQYVNVLATRGLPPECAVTELHYHPSKAVLHEMDFDFVAGINNEATLSGVFGRAAEFKQLLLGGYNYEEQEEAAPETTAQKGKKEKF